MPGFEGSAETSAIGIRGGQAGTSGEKGQAPISSQQAQVGNATEKNQSAQNDNSVASQVVSTAKKSDREVSRSAG